MTDEYPLLSEKITVYIFDLLSFTNNYSEKEIPYNLREKAERLKILSAELTNKQTDKSKLLKKIQEIFDSLIDDLKRLKCPDNLLIEKTDLSVRAFIIREQCDKLLSSFDFT